MIDSLTARAALESWHGTRGTYHLVIFTGEAARLLGERAMLDRLELGRRRGFGSIKVAARIGETHWKTSVFPQRAGAEQGSGNDYVLLISRKVVEAEGLAVDQQIDVALTF